MSYNRVILMGNLTRNPEVRYAPSGTAVANFGLALNEKWGEDGERKERVTFVDVTMFGKRAEAFVKFHGKGHTALVEGRLRLDTWEDKNDGSKRSKLYVVADSWEFAGAKREESPADSAPEYSDSDLADTPF